MLTADAFGVLPPIARLSPAGAMYHFLSGYTAKVAGTERGVTEPKATFSTCFGAPFMALIRPCTRSCSASGSRGTTSRVWLVNTGWTGGPYGVGTRMKIAYTRAMIRAALAGALDHVALPSAIRSSTSTCRESCPGVPADVLESAQHLEGPAAYDEQAAQARADVRRELQDVRGRRLRRTVRAARAETERERLVTGVRSPSSVWRSTRSS